MFDLELFPAPLAGFAFMVSLQSNGTWSVRAQQKREGAGFEEGRTYSDLSLGEVCDVVCAELYMI